MNTVHETSPMNEWLESAWLSSYLDRQLDEHEIAWFEAYVLDKPKLLDAIDVDTRLRHAIATNSRTAFGGSKNISAATVGRLMAKPGMRRHTWLAMAASLVIGLGLGIFTIPRISTEQIDANPTRVIYDSMRGGAVRSPRIENAASKSAHILVEVPIPAGATAIRLKNGGAEQPLTPSPDGFVNFLIDRKSAQTTALEIEFEAQGRTQSIRLSALLSALPSPSQQSTR